mmetsp:Transcript_22206/g.33916  ORF Transcript_22206/g.33916 Transcript_22206/m.33916 type:complete len:85 (-) Transcript_22206:309-563(-)
MNRGAHMPSRFEPRKSIHDNNNDGAVFHHHNGGDATTVRSNDPAHESSGHKGSSHGDGHYGPPSNANGEQRWVPPNSNSNTKQY